MRCINRRFPVHSILIHQGGYRAYRTSETTTDCVACRSGKAGVAGAAPENRAAHGATFQDRSSCWQGTGQSGDRSATERDRRNRREVQALDRTQPILPLRPGLPEQRTHDYERHGTTSLFAALDIATGKVIGKCRRRHRHQEFLQFMEYVDSGLPPEAGEIHLVLDNYGTHKTPKVVRWFARHPRYHLHFTPTSGSWVNQVERWFAEITNKRIRRGSFDSVRSLEKAI